MDLLNSLFLTFEDFSIFGYGIIFLAIFVESLAFIGMTVPGTAFVVLIGFMSSRGFINLAGAVVFVTAGAIAGDMVSYYLGGHVKKFFHRDSKIFKSRYLDRGKLFFHVYGGRSILLGRFIGPIRPVIPFVAGLSKMDEKKFILWDIAGAISWSAFFILLGFFFGRAWRVVAARSEEAGILIAALVGIFILFYVAKRLVIKSIHGKRREQ